MFVLAFEKYGNVIKEYTQLALPVNNDETTTVKR